MDGRFHYHLCRGGSIVGEVVVVSRLMTQSLVVYGGDKCQTGDSIRKSRRTKRRRSSSADTDCDWKVNSSDLYSSCASSDPSCFILTRHRRRRLLSLLAFTDSSFFVCAPCFRTQPAEAPDGILWTQIAPLSEWRCCYWQPHKMIRFTAVSANNNVEAGAVGDHRWHLMLPTSDRVSAVTYAAVAATR